MSKFTMNDLSQIANLPFDNTAMLNDLRTWVEIESPTHDADAVNRMMDHVRYDLTVAGAYTERVKVGDAYGDCILGRFPHPNANVPGILILGHMDTVHPVGTLQKFPWRIEGGYAYGPGVLDMKAGNYLALEAMRQLNRAGLRTPLPVTMLLTSDEEVGSPACRSLIEAEAARHAYVLVPEPARRNAGVVTGRYAIARFRLIAHGEPSHAGRMLGEGASAISEICRQVLAVEALTEPEVTYSVGVIRGGEWANCVATTCHAEILVAATTDARLEEAVERLASLTSINDAVRLEVERGVTRPVWEPTAASWRLYEHAAELANKLGFEIFSQSSGGGSDGNFTGAMGLSTLDGLGARGDKPHTLEEHIIIDSLSERGRLVAALLATIGMQ